MPMIIAALNFIRKKKKYKRKIIWIRENDDANFSRTKYNQSKSNLTKWTVKRHVNDDVRTTCAHTQTQSSDVHRHRKKLERTIYLDDNNE